VQLERTETVVFSRIVKVPWIDKVPGTEADGK
jgi:hypothetical protein